MVQLSCLCLTTGKTFALAIQSFVSKVMSPLFNMVSRSVIIFLPRKWKIFSLKTIRHWWNKMKTMQVNGKIYCSQGLEESILLKWQFSPNWSVYSTWCYQISSRSFFFFCRYWQIYSKYIWKYKRPTIAKTILTKKNKLGALKLSNFKTYSNVLIIKTAWHWHRVDV